MKILEEGGKSYEKIKIFSILSIITIIINIIFPIISSEVYAGVTDVTEGSGVKVNTTVIDHYDDIDITNDIVLEKGKDYIIYCAKEDNLSKALSAIADLEGTVYYKIVVNDGKASLEWKYH